MQVKIKNDARIFQDYLFCRWPGCRPPLEEVQRDTSILETKYPDAIFNAEWKDDYWNCSRPGYGEKPYGNGSIFVLDKDGVEIIK